MKTQEGTWTRFIGVWCHFSTYVFRHVVGVILSFLPRTFHIAKLSFSIHLKCNHGTFRPRVSLVTTSERKRLRTTAKPIWPTQRAYSLINTISAPLRAASRLYSCAGARRAVAIFPIFPVRLIRTSCRVRRIDRQSAIRLIYSALIQLRSTSARWRSRGVCGIFLSAFSATFARGITDSRWRDENFNKP